MAAMLLFSASGVNPAAAATGNQSAMSTHAATSTDLSARRHHRHYSYVRPYRRAFAYYPRYSRPYYRSYRAFGYYRPVYRPYDRPYYGAPYAYYRPPYGWPHCRPYYGPRTFVSIGPFGFGIGFGSGFF